MCCSQFCSVRARQGIRSLLVLEGDVDGEGEGGKRSDADQMPQIEVEPYVMMSEPLVVSPMKDPIGQDSYDERPAWS